MRELLEAFRLPGESQQIERITETFADVYFSSGPGKLDFGSPLVAPAHIEIQRGLTHGMLFMC